MTKTTIIAWHHDCHTEVLQQKEPNRYYIPLTGKGKLAVKLGLHRDLKDALPMSMKNLVIPAFNWFSRTKIKLKTALKG